jgi:hypothetical protein
VSFARTPLIFALFISLGLAAAADPPAKTEKSDKAARPTKEQIAKWVKELGDNDFDTREAATQKLWEAGDAAEPALAEAVKSDDAEINRRAQEILDKFKLGIYPSTPKPVVEMITRFQAGDRNTKLSILRELVDAGPPGCKAVLKLASIEEDKDLKHALLNQLSTHLPRTLPTLLAAKDFTTLETLLGAGLASSLDSDTKTGLTNIVAYWLLRGQIDEKIGHYKALEAKSDKPKEQAEILAYLHRAKGDLVAAREAALRAGKPDLAEALAYEAADWKGLAGKDPIFETSRPIEKLGYRAAYHRLAGNTKAFEEAIADIRKAGMNDALPGDEEDGLFYVAKALFLNQRPRDGLEILLRSDRNSQAAFEILIAQMKYREALALVEKTRAAAAKIPGEEEKKKAESNLAPLEILEARTLYNLGEKAKAQAIFTRYSAQVRQGNEVSWYEDLVDSEYRVGLTDEAFAHAAQVLGFSEDHGWAGRFFRKLFPGRSESAESLWTVLKALFPLDDPQAQMKRLRSVLAGKVEAKELGRWIQNAEASIKNQRPEIAERWWMALADAALACNHEEQARLCLEKAANAQSLVKLGDLLAAKKEWERASQRYYQGWEKNREAALPLYLSGKALVQAGKAEEGKTRIEHAHWLPLGNEVARRDLCEGLGKHNDVEGTRREIDLLLKLSQPGSYDYGEGLRRAALEAVQRKDLVRSADLQERAMLRCLRTYISFMAKSAYVGVPGMIHRQRASGFLAAGKIKEALEQIALCQECLPGNIDLVIQVVPELERLGMKKEAGELFTKTVAVYADLCKDYPKCAWAHNSVAWLSASCRRNLDDALTHALKAVELAPKAAGHLDTLGEVYFQRGDKAKAIETAKKVVEMEPKRVYFRKQLKRIEAGDPKAPLPPENDEEEDE